MTDSLPRRHFLPGRWFGHLMLRLTGWRVEGALPPVAKCVVVVAPHTSNWDFFFGMAAALALDLDASWFGKHTLFRLPTVAWLLTRLGGIPVDRSHPQGVIQQVIDLCRSRQQFLFGIAPEGTRSRVTRWKTGAYLIARATGMPILPVRFDYPRRRITILEPYQPGPDMEQEMLRLSSFYSSRLARKPEKFSPHQSDVTPPPPPGAGDC
ncbi:MAG: 1-acyl-sn-glycerol-3-phosphate acyltransferase [Desulfuromonadales bacterium]|nr:1-acyl-sn-glycerol-3-phosphate acyltransferase [Desulfuromonadales bacterium]